jgi:hypothetical protein
MVAILDEIGIPDLIKLNRRDPDHIIHGRSQPSPSFLISISLRQKTTGEILVAGNAANNLIQWNLLRPMLNRFARGMELLLNLPEGKEPRVFSAKACQKLLHHCLLPGAMKITEC